MSDMTTRLVVEATPGSTTITINTRRGTRREVVTAIRQTAIFARAEKIDIVSNKNSVEVMTALLKDAGIQDYEIVVEEVIAGEHVSKCRCSCGR